MKLLKRVYDFCWCLTMLIPMAWRLTSGDWDLTFSKNGFTGRRKSLKEGSWRGDKNITGAMSDGCILTIRVALQDSINRGRDKKACEFALSEFDSALQNVNTQPALKSAITHKEVS